MIGRIPPLGQQSSGGVARFQARHVSTSSASPFGSRRPAGLPLMRAAWPLQTSLSPNLCCSMHPILQWLGRLRARSPDTAGGGVEYGITGNWLLKAEYLYVGFPSQSLTEINPAFPTFTASASNRLSASIVRVGLQVRLAVLNTEPLQTPAAWRYWLQCPLCSFTMKQGVALIGADHGGGKRCDSARSPATD
jgi:hypothetical protein